MSTSLWPALLAAIVGGGGGGAGKTTAEHGAASLGPIQSLLATAVLGEHALYWWIGLLCFVGLAYATNPTEASFRTHLTDLSFHLHLRRLRAHETDHSNRSNPSQSLPGDFKRPGSPSAAPGAVTASAAAKDGLSSSSNGGKVSSASGKASKTSSNQGSVDHQSISNSAGHVRAPGQVSLKPGRNAHANGESGRPHVLSFSNRVSISLKTPAYVRTSYGLWSTARILPAATPKNTSGSYRASGRASGTPARPLLNGVPAVTRRASTTLTTLNDRTSKKSSSSSASGAASSSSKSTRKGGLVSTVAHGISASLSAPVCTPWLEQGGYFIGFLGYWWTVDDGTSFSGAREKTRLGNALLALEEQDEEDDISVDQHGPDSSRHADDLEGGQAFYDNGQAQPQSSRIEDQSVNSVTVNVVGPKRKHPSKASQGASFRGGQRRSSPTPRQVSNKKRGSGSGSAGGAGTHNTASQAGSSGDVTPIIPTAAIPLDGNHLTRHDYPLQTNDDSQLPGLPFHVDRTKETTSDQQFSNEEAVATVNTCTKEGEDGLSAISHSASAPDAAVATVSPTLALLQNQLDDLRATSSATQAKLEAEIEELQSRRRDEDAVRIELKARTKVLEESKREAETERLDAEKKLTTARSSKKSIEDKVSKARSELTKLEKKEKELQEKMLKSREERKVKLDELRDKVKHREALLIKEVESTERLDKRVALLEKEIEDRKQDLFQFRREEANAAAIAVTNRMNRAGRGLAGGNAGGAPAPASANTTVTGSNTAPVGGAHGNHVHPHYPQAGGTSITAKRHMQPIHSGHAHRHPSQHPNAAVPVAYPYNNPEDQANARSPSPGGLAATAAGLPAPSGTLNAEGGQGQTFGSSFLDHRMQSRRAASAAGIGNPSAFSSSMNTSLIGNTASAASALYSRQIDSKDDDRVEGVPAREMAEEQGRNMAPGSTFAPFGPASPTSPSTIGANSPREQHSLLKKSSPSLDHVPYFASDKASQAQQQHPLRMSTSRECILGPVRAQAGMEDTDYMTAADAGTTPVMGLAQQLAAVDDGEDSYALSKPRAFTKETGNTSGLRRQSFGSEASFTSSNGGPLSPMTPHQASLIPSQLFDMLDEVEMPASPTPFQLAGGATDPHQTFTRGISDAIDQASSDNHDGQQQAAKRTSGLYSPWADLDMGTGFDFDKPLGAGYHANSAGVSRKTSGRDTLGFRHQPDLLRRRSGSELHNAPSLEHAFGNTGTMHGDAIFATYGPAHGHHGGIGNAGQRSNTSSSGGSISPHLASSGSVNLPAGFGKLSPNDLLFDKARHVLSLNPDAKAFSFNRPLPSSGSAGSLNSIGGGGRGGQLPSNAVGAIGDARHAFDYASGGHQGINGGADSPVLSNGTISTAHATWSSPNLASRGSQHLGYGIANASSTHSGPAGSTGNVNLRESVRSASGPPLTNPSTAAGSTAHSFSPFDDDDLLKGW